MEKRRVRQDRLLLSSVDHNVESRDRGGTYCVLVTRRAPTLHWRTGDFGNRGISQERGASVTSSLNGRLPLLPGMESKNGHVVSLEATGSFRSCLVQVKNSDRSIPYIRKRYGIRSVHTALRRRVLQASLRQEPDSAGRTIQPCIRNLDALTECRTWQVRRRVILARQVFPPTRARSCGLARLAPKDRRAAVSARVAGTPHFDRHWLVVSRRHRPYSAADMTSHTLCRAVGVAACRRDWVTK